jgi:hypothetical protein
MNWEALGAVAGIAGAVAVIVSLVYLAIQIHQSTRATRASTYQSIVLHGGAMLRAIMENPELADLVIKADQAGVELTPSEAFRYSAFASAVFRYYDSLYYHWRRGTLEQGQWHGFEEFLRGMLRSDGLVRWWHEHGHVFDPEFRAHVARLLADKGSDGEQTPSN